MGFGGFTLKDNHGIINFSDHLFCNRTKENLQKTYFFVACAYQNVSVVFFHQFIQARNRVSESHIGDDGYDAV
jgi:hypothetical protein